MISAGSLFSRQSAPLLGIDISSSSVKLVELGRDKAGGLVLERCAIEPLERGWITDGNIEKFEEVANALKRWHPQRVLFVGAATGVPGRVKLGDVLLPEQIIERREWFIPICIV